MSVFRYQQIKRVVGACLCGLMLLFTQSALGQDKFLEEAAQEKYLRAMSLYDNGEYDAALTQLGEARKEAKKLPRSWRKNVMKVIDGAEVGVLYEAGLMAFESESFQNAYAYFERCLRKMGKKDSRRGPIAKNMTKSAYMLTIQLWLNHRYQQARETARVAQKYAKEAFPKGTKLRDRLDEVHTKITMKHTDELVSQGEIKTAFRELKKDFKILPDPRFAYQLGELGMQLRAYSQAEKYFKKAQNKALAAGDASEAALQELVQDSKERLVHIRSLRKKVIVRSNVPLYQVEVFRPFVERPIAQKQAEDPNAGVTFELYPGRYRFRVVNPDYGVCVKEDIPVRKGQIDIDCDFERPPTSVSFDTTPSGTQVKVVPSTMVAFRKTPFYTELYQGSYTLLVKMRDYPETVEIPFLVEREDQQEFTFSLDFAELDIMLPEMHQDAVVKVDGRLVPSTLNQPYRVGVGTHVIEVRKPGYETITQRMLMGPREIKTLMYDLIPIIVEVDEGRMRTQGALDIGLSYELQLVNYTATGLDENGDEGTLVGAFAAHVAEMGTRIYLGGSAKSSAKPYLLGKGSANFALDNPIQSIFAVGGGAGVGLLMDRMVEGEWITELTYELESQQWEDIGEETAHTSSMFMPVGLGVHVAGHASFFHTNFTFDFKQGVGRRDDLVQRCSQDVSLSHLEVSGFAGADLVDAFSAYNPDFDFVLGVGGGFYSYSEVQTNLNNGPGCEALSPQGIELGDPRVFSQAKLRYVTGLLPRTAVTFEGNLGFVGGVHPLVPLIYDDKINIEAEGLNSNFRLGLELLF